MSKLINILIRILHYVLLPSWILTFVGRILIGCSVLVVMDQHSKVTPLIEFIILYWMLYPLFQKGYWFLIEYRGGKYGGR